MKNVSVLAGLILATYLVGCVPSLRGISDKETVVFEKSLIGIWLNGDNKDRWEFIQHPNESNKYGVIYYEGKTSKSGYFIGALNRLNGELYLDISPEFDEEQANSFYWFHAWPMHTFIHIKLDNTLLQMRMMNPDALDKLLEANPQLIKHEKIDDRIILTDSSENLRKLITDNFQTDDFFGDPMELKRKDPEMMINIGEPAPDFNIPDQNGNSVSLRSFKGKKNVVLIFYPGDNTPGCTKQLCAVRDDYSDFEKAGVAFFGVNPQSAESHQNFIDKYSFQFPILVDTDRTVINAYGCAKGNSTQRTVYAINKNGIVVYAKQGMPANSEILSAFE